MSALLAPLALATLSCGGADEDTASVADPTPAPGGAVTASATAALPDRVGESDYDRLSDELQDLPDRVIPRLEPDQRLRFPSQSEATSEFVAAVTAGDFDTADRIVASVDAGERSALLMAGAAASSAAWGKARDSGDYTELYRLDRYLKIDPFKFWQLDGTFVDGVVVDASSGMPVAGASLSTQSPWDWQVTSDASGRFRILLPQNGAMIGVEHPDFESVWARESASGRPFVPEKLAGADIEIALVPVNDVPRPDLPSLTFRGRVVDAATGEPLAGLPVVAAFDAIEGAPDLAMRQLSGDFGRETDADGRFEITDLPVQTINLLAQGPSAGKLYILQQPEFRFEDGAETLIEVHSREVRADIPMIVAGVVRDRVTGEPVAGARVSAGGWKAERSDANGHFLIQLDTGKDWQLTATHEAYHASAPQAFASAEPRSIEAEFLLDPITTGTIVGTAINAVTGEPIANAVIEIAGQRVRTDSRGRFSAKEVEAGAVDVNGAQSGYRSAQEQILLEALQTVDATLELEPITTGTVTGVVVDAESGAAIAGAAVRAAEISGTSGDDGRFVLENVEAGRLEVAASKALFISGSTPVALAAMDTVETRVELEAITWGTVRGTVTDATTGEPLAGARIRLGGNEVTTDDVGRFVAVRVPAGDVTLLGTLASYRDGRADLQLPRDGDVVQNIVLQPITTGTVFVRVLDATSKQPITGADVMIGTRKLTTDNDGRITAPEVPAGMIAANASARLYEPASARGVLQAAGEARLEVELIPITWGAVFGVVTNQASGVPVANAAVRIGEIVLRSDEAGLFRAERVPAGSVAVSAEMPRYRSDRETIALERGGEQQVDLQLDPITTGTLQGRVVNADDGSSLSGATVTAGGLSARSGSDGRFSIEQVAAGDITARAEATLFVPNEATVIVEAAGTADVEIKLTPIIWGTISGAVVDAKSGKPIADARVSAGEQSARTDAAGSFTLERVAAGDVSVHAAKPVYVDGATTLALAKGASETVTLRLEPITWGAVTGRVTDSETGRPLADADVTVGTQSTRTDSSGRFRVEKVPAGRLQVAGRTPAYEPNTAYIELAADGERDVTLTLDPVKVGNVTGRVVDAKTGDAIGEARVTLGPGGITTDPKGGFRFDGVNAGRLVVAARHPDYANGSASLDVVAADTVEVVIRLDLRREDVTSLEAELAKSGTVDLYGIYFDSAKAQFKPSSLATLNAVLAVMKRAPERRFRIAGHTDSDGGSDYNQDLSERRANTVIGWLVDNGIEAGRLEAAGYGETRPAAPNDTETGKALNRRVELSYLN